MKIDRKQKAGQLYTSGLQAVTRGGDSLHHLAQHLPLMIKGTDDHPGPLWPERALEPDGKLVRLNSFLEYLMKPAREGLQLPGLYFLKHVLEAAKDGDRAMALVRAELKRVDDIDFDEQADCEHKKLMAEKSAPKLGVNQHTEGFDIIKPSKAKGGTSAEYLAARLARDFKELSARTLLPKADKRRLSIRAAAIEAGIVKPPTALETILKLLPKLTATERRQLRTRLDEVMRKRAA